jgi:hypothetical protein
LWVYSQDGDASLKKRRRMINQVSRFSLTSHGWAIHFHISADGEEDEVREEEDGRWEMGDGRWGGGENRSY